jgi:pyrophosphate--fructose-6-phosphate 1-phosphotransferase
MSKISALQKARAAYCPKLPPALKDGANARMVEGKPTTSVSDAKKIKALFPATFGSPEITSKSTKKAACKAVKVGA